MSPRFAGCNRDERTIGCPLSSANKAILARLGHILRSGILYLAVLLIATSANAGNVVLTGHDDDFHSFFHSPSNAAAQAQAIIAFVRAGAPNPALPVLAFDHGSELTSLLTSLGIPFSNIDPDAGVPAAALFDVTRFSAIVIASDLTCGGCDNTPTSSTNLSGASTAIAAFFSAGGGIAAFAGAQNTSYYRFVPASASGFGNPPPTGYVQTALGVALGIPAVNGDPTHNFFFTPGTNGVSAAYGVVETLGVGGQIETIACQGCGAAEIGTFFSFLGTSGTTINPTASYAEPVNTAIGNYYMSHTDLIVPGKGFPFRFSRSYNSRDPYSGPLGTGWTHNYNLFLTVDNVAGTVSIKQQDGSVITFSRAASGAYTPSTVGLFDQFQMNGDGSFTLTKKDQSTLTFTSAGRLATITDRNGNYQLLSYDSGGNLISVTDTAGRSFSFIYDALLRISSITDPSGRILSYSYDANGNLASYRDPLGNTAQYVYDAGHHLVSATDPRNVTYLQNVYDPQGRVTTQTNARGFVTTFAYNSPAAGTTSITDVRGNQTIHTYDTLLRIVKITDAANGTISFTYDANNDRSGVTNQNGKTTFFAYDTRGNATAISDPLGNAISFVYDAKNGLLSATNAKGKTTSFSYDGNENLTRIQDALGNATNFSYNGFGQLKSNTDARSSAITYAYDSFGNLSGITDALGHATALTYDGVGRLTSITDANSHTATATYDALSRLIKIKDPLGNLTQFVYDAIGDLLKITDANGNTTSYTYDGTDNLENVTDALGRVTQYAYDANNNRTSFTNAKGNKTSYFYDALNRLSRSTDPLAFATSYIYDAIGNVKTVTDAKGQANTFAYDALNRLNSIAYADGKTVSYSYDTNGNRTSMVDSHGTTNYAYDDLNRLMSVTQPGGKVVAYGFDAVGNRRSLTYPDGKQVSYTYDPVNRLAAVGDWLGRTTQYSYDPASNLLRVAYPNQAAVSFAYDLANRLVGVRNIVRRGDSDDSNHDRDRDDDRNPISSFNYVLDAVGNRLEVSDGTGKITTYAYDPLYELTSVTLGDHDRTGPDEDDLKNATRFAYDAVGNRLSQTTRGQTILYGYDAADRLLAASGSSFTYDANGNQVSKTQGLTGLPIVYNYDAANRLTSVIGGIFTSSFFYDGDGNRISQSIRAGTYNYLNDVASALPVVLQESGPDGNISYAHGLGLISETAAKFDSFYQYDGLGSVVGLTDARGRLKASYSYDAWGQATPPYPDDETARRNKFRFTGEAIDPATELYYLRARYYDPSTGRFLTKDDVFGIVRQPRTLNHYAYALNQPTLLTDPTGKFVWFLPGVVGAVVNDGFYTIEVLAGKDNFSFSTLAGKTVGGFVAPYAFAGCLAAGPVAGGACAGASEYIVDRSVQYGIAAQAQDLTGTSNPLFAAQSSSLGGLLGQTALSALLGPVSQAISDIIGPNVGRNPTQIVTLLTGLQTQKAFAQETLDELAKSIGNFLFSPATAK
jgi:RHS repeat-associated protein